MSRRMEALLSGATILLLIVFRSSFLGADPPLELTFSTGIYTDPPQYTLFAKQLVALGELNPFSDPRFVFFINSLVTAVATAVFFLFGIGVTTSHLTGLILSFGALLLMFVTVRRIASPTAAILFLLLAGLNYNLVVFGRFPFLEHAMTVLAFASLAVIVYRHGWIAHLVGGLLLGAAILFGKVIGIVFLFPFACYYAFRLAADRPSQPRLSWRRPLVFAIGLIALAAAWYLAIYQPSQAQVSGYLQEHSVSLYGAPEGLESIDKFIYKLVSFGGHSKLLERMAVPGVLAVVFITVVLLPLCRKEFWRDRVAWFNAGHVFLAAMIVAFVGSLMIWNYRPLRYQLVLIYPACAAAGIMLTAMWHRVRPGLPKEVPWYYYLIIYPALLVVFYHLNGWVVGLFDRELFYVDVRVYIFTAMGLFVIVLPFVLRWYRQLDGRTLKILSRSIAAVLLIAAIANSISNYFWWAQRPTYTIRDTGRELGYLLNDGAVLSGPFAPALTLENDLQTVIHMFGVSNPDPELFHRFPITHLLLDQQNEDRAREDYPEVIDSSLHVATLRVGTKLIRLYNVSQSTGNPRAAAYQPTLFEEGAAMLLENRLDEAMAAMHRFNQQYPENYTGLLVIATLAQQGELWDSAEGRLKKAVEISPTNYVLNEKLATFYRDRYAAFGDPADKELGLKYYRRAMFYAPTSNHLPSLHYELQESEPWQLNDTTSSSQP
ncbi:hypothetical protein GF420_09520 [candidate division GN15 bacterium]|nr:hypothetical protein [candidate division GN15 bacterium]